MDRNLLGQYAAECAELHQRQATPDSEEALASIPLLERTDIRKETEMLKVEKEAVEGGTLLYQALPTNKVTYLNWYFDMTGISPELLPYCNLLSDVLGKLNTEEYSYAELAKYTDMYTGGISFQYGKILPGGQMPDGQAAGTFQNFECDDITYAI